MAHQNHITFSSYSFVLHESSRRINVIEAVAHTHTHALRSSVALQCKSKCRQTINYISNCAISLRHFIKCATHCYYWSEVALAPVARHNFCFQYTFFFCLTFSWCLSSVALRAFCFVHLISTWNALFVIHCIYFVWRSINKWNIHSSCNSRETDIMIGALFTDNDTRNDG